MQLYTRMDIIEARRREPSPSSTESQCVLEYYEKHIRRAYHERKQWVTSSMVVLAIEGTDTSRRELSEDCAIIPVSQQS